MIEIKNLTMVYPISGKGIFNIDLSVAKGQVVGFLGPNGAGKTTTIRCLLGFMRGKEGRCTINGQNCFENAPENMRDVGFIAGEPAFPDAMTGLEYLNFLIDVRTRKDENHSRRDTMHKKMQELIRYFEFDPKGKIKRMSKGMKQKTAIVAAFMHTPAVLILDEPTSGLDPLMQNKFVELLLEEKKRDATILMSSHMFEEVERTCEDVVIIKDGKIVAADKVKNLKRTQKITFIVTSPESKKIKLSFDTAILEKDKIETVVPCDQVDKFIKELSKYNVKWLKIKEQSLEDVFMGLYTEGEAK